MPIFHDRPARGSRGRPRPIVTASRSTFRNIRACTRSSRRAGASTGNRSKTVRCSCAADRLFTGTPPMSGFRIRRATTACFRVDRHGRRALKNLGFLGSIDQNANMYKTRRGGYSRSRDRRTDPISKVSSLWKSNPAQTSSGAAGIHAQAPAKAMSMRSTMTTTVSEVAEGKCKDQTAVKTARPSREILRREQDAQPDERRKRRRFARRMLRNTNKGYSFYTTLQIQEEFVQGPLVSTNGSYTMGTARSVTDGTSSVATSAWKYTQKVAVNSEELGYSAGSFDGRLLLSAFYTARWGQARCDQLRSGLPALPSFPLLLLLRRRRQRRRSGRPTT